MLVVRAVSAGSPGHYDPDPWWVAAAGRELLGTGRVPVQNGFSFVDGGQPWVMHEWLLGPLYAWGLATLGPAFFALLAVVAGAVTLTLVFRVLARDSGSVLAAWITSAVVVVSFSDRFVTARPTGVALVFPVALLALTLARAFRRREALLATFVMLVWTNAHGSFPLGIAILAGGALFEEGRRARVAALLTGAAVTLCNPYGLRLHRFVLHYLLGDEPVFALVHRRIAEFAPLYRAESASSAWVALGLVALLGLTVAGIFGSRVTATRGRALACLPLLLIALRNARHLELAGLLSVMLLAPAASTLVARLGARPASPPRWLPWLGVIAGGAGLAAWLLLTRPRGDELLGAHRGVALLAPKVPDEAHVYAPFDSAGLVTWLAYPRRVLTLADSRNDCFRAPTLEAFFDLETGDATADPQKLGGILMAMNVTHALLPDDHPEASRLRTLEGWNVAAQAAGWTLFSRTP